MSELGKRERGGVIGGKEKEGEIEGKEREREVQERGGRIEVVLLIRVSTYIVVKRIICYSRPLLMWWKCYEDLYTVQSKNRI